MISDLDNIILTCLNQADVLNENFSLEFHLLKFKMHILCINGIYVKGSLSSSPARLIGVTEEDIACAGLHDNLFP